MSGGELDLDAIETRARALTYALGRDHIGAVASFGHTVGDQDVPDLVAEVRGLRALSDRLREQLQHDCPHGEMSWSGVDQTPLDDPAKGWACDNCGKALDADEVREPKRPEGSSARALAEEHCPSAFNGPFCDKARGILAALGGP